MDWDTLSIALKECDLRFVGGGIGQVWKSASDEALFYQRYGPAEINPIALAHFRYERVVQNIAALGEQLLATDAGGDDREQSLRYVTSFFLPNSEIEITGRSDPLSPPG